MPEPFDSDNIPTSPMPPVRPAPGSAAAGAPTIGTPAARWSFTALATSDLQPHFPNLEILAPIGQGGMGAVYKARQISLDRVVALKILPPEVGFDPNFSERFTREGKAMARLNHPNVVAVFDSGRVTTPIGEMYFFVMEFVDGPNLRGLMVGGHIKPTQAVEIVGQICEALHYAHDEGLVHRDIKPENVLIDQRLRIKVADFGLAKIMTRQLGSTILTRADGIMGTPQYMAPEQVETPLKVDARADIYSVGVMLYEMLTGGLPMGRFDAPSKSAGVPVGLDTVVFKSLEKDPSKRYPTASEMKLAMNSAMGTPAAVHAPGSPGAAQRRGRLFGLNLRIGSMRLAISLAALCVLVAIPVSFVFTPGLWSGRLPGGAAPPTGVPPPAGPATPIPPAPPGPGDVPNPKGDAGRRLIEIRRGGPVLSDHAAEVLALTPIDRVKVDGIIKLTLAESVRLERGASKVTKGERAGGVRIQISEYAAAQVALRTKFAGDLGAVLSDAQKLKVMEISRRQRPGEAISPAPGRGRPPSEPKASDWDSWASNSLNPAFGELFPKADETRTIDIWRDKDRYFFAEATRSSAGTPIAGDSLAVVPARYRAYWLMYGDASAEVKELVAEVERDVTARRRVGDRARLIERIRSMSDGEGKIRRILEDSGVDLPPGASPQRIAMGLEQLVRALQGLPDMEDPENPK